MGAGLAMLLCAAAVLAHGVPGGTSLRKETNPREAAPAQVREPLRGALADEPVAPLVVREHAGVARVSAPVTGGVPVAPFKVKSADELGLFDAEGRPVPTQIVPTVTAPDGTLTWVLVDFTTTLKPNQVKAFTLKKALPPKPTGPAVQVDDAEDRITVTTGPLCAAMAKRQFDLFEEVWLDKNGDGRYTDEERLLNPDRPARPAALTITDAVTGKTYSSSGGPVQRVVLEDSGPMRATVRVDGAFGGEAGETYLQYTARLTFWANSPNVKVLYAIRNTKTGTPAKIKSATVALDLAENQGVKEYLVGAAEPHVSRLYRGDLPAQKETQRHWAVRLEQRGPNRAITSRTDRATFHMGTEFDEMGFRVIQEQPGKPTKRHRYVDCGMHCEGWLDLTDATGGCLVWLRNFTQNPLKRLRATSDGLITLDLIPEYAGEDQMFYAGGGFWMTDSAYRTYELGFHFHPTPYAREEDWRRWMDSFNVYDPVCAETAFAVGEAVTFFEHPLVLTADPRWYSDTGALCGPIPSEEDEVRVNRLWGRIKEGPVRPHRQEMLGTEFLPRENYHWRSESDEPRDCLVTYVRTGEYDFLKRARSFANVARDLGVFRRDHGLPAGKAPPANPQTPAEKGLTGTGWGTTKMCGCHNYGAGLVDMWLMLGDRSYLDAAVDNALNHVGSRISGLDRGASRIAAGALRVLEVTHDPRLRDWLKNAVAFGPPDEGLRREGLGVARGECVGSWMYAINVYAKYRNLMLNGDVMDPLLRDETRDRIIAWARVGASTADAEAAKPKTKVGYGLCALYFISLGYELTGDRGILENARKIWDKEHHLGPDVVDARLRDWGPSSGMNLYWVRYLFEAYAHPRRDASPPAAITDLAAEALGGGRVRLTWTAPADEGGGTVAEYQLKHAPRPIVTWDQFYAAYPDIVGQKYSWFGAHNVAGEPRPAAPGTRQSMVLEGVPAGTRYFRLRAWDNSMNQGPLSNEVTVEVK